MPTFPSGVNWSLVLCSSILWHAPVAQHSLVIAELRESSYIEQAPTQGSHLSVSFGTECCIRQVVRGLILVPESESYWWRVRPLYCRRRSLFPKTNPHLHALPRNCKHNCIRRNKSVFSVSTTKRTLCFCFARCSLQLARRLSSISTSDREWTLMRFAPWEPQARDDSSQLPASVSDSSL